MTQIKNRKFTILGLFIILTYTFFIWPYPEKYPILTHRAVDFFLILLMGVLAYIDERKLKEENNK